MKVFSKIIIYCMSILILIIVFIDNYSLNSLFMNDDDFVVNEVAVLTVDYDKIVHNETDAVSKETPTLIDSPTVTNTQPVSNVAFSDYWEWPTEKNYTITTYYSSYHRAIDIYSYSGNGSNIYAANNGTVSLVKSGCVVGDLSCNGKGGNYIVINHNNNYYTVYMHLKSINVKVGDTVSRGQIIGYMGNTGNVIPVPSASSPYSGTHLHFCLYVGEPYKDGYAINPMNLY